MPSCESFDALEIHLPMAIRVSDTGLVSGDAVDCFMLFLVYVLYRKSPLHSHLLNFIDHYRITIRIIASQCQATLSRLAGRTTPRLQENRRVD